MATMKPIKPEVTDQPTTPPVAPVTNKEPLPKVIVVIVYVLLVGLGVFTGYLLTGNSGSVATDGTDATKTAVTSDGKKAFGSSDTKTFNTSAIGVVQAGGIEKEGTQTLIRDGGPTQTVCMVSSTLDLTQFIGKKVKVFGITNAAKKCPWLMDIGRVEVQ
jgi:hypothetical protein